MAMHLRGEGRIMNTTYHTETKRLTAASGVAATAVMAPTLLFAGAGVAVAETANRLPLTAAGFSGSVSHS